MLIVCHDDNEQEAKGLSKIKGKLLLNEYWCTYITLIKIRNFKTAHSSVCQSHYIKCFYGI